jgi:STE24 endopeptidase
MDSKKYNNIKLASAVWKAVASFLLILFFVLSGLSRSLLVFVQHFSSNNYILFFMFLGICGVATGFIFAPLNYYTHFYIEHKYKLSNQTLIGWMWEDAKGLFVSLVIGIPVLLLFFWMLRRYGAIWWLPMSVFLFILSVLLARIVPVFILPLFYKITPLEDEDLISRIKILAKYAGMKVQNIYKFNMSKNTKKANAAFTGIGKSKRILLGDTLLDNFSKDEIETVLAHELGHYKKKHIIKNIIIGTATSFFTLFFIAFFYDKSLPWFHFTSRIDISALPLLSLWTMLIGVLLTPIGNIISRKYEYEADNYAITSTGKPTEFIATIEKLNEQNLGDKDPHPFVEWFFYSHPSIKKRIAAINK